jgi:hypothetical protein
MKTPEKHTEHIKRLEWMIWFCQADLKTFSQGDWLNAADSMYDFADFGDPDSPLHQEFYRYARAKDMVDFQPRVSKVLRRLAVDPQQPNADDEYGPLINAQVTIGAFGADQPFEQITESTLELTILGYLALFRHLVASEIVRGQLRVCPQCKRLFLSRRRPRADKTLHCSLRCSRLAATHRYRERQREELKRKERDRSHSRYAKSQKRKLGRGTKVGRRPRKKSLG